MPPWSQVSCQTRELRHSGKNVLAIEAQECDGREHGEGHDGVGRAYRHVVPGNLLAECIRPGAAVVSGQEPPQVTKGVDGIDDVEDDHDDDRGTDRSQGHIGQHAHEEGDPRGDEQLDRDVDGHDAQALPRGRDVKGPA